MSARTPERRLLAVSAVGMAVFGAALALPGVLASTVTRGTSPAALAVALFGGLLAGTVVTAAMSAPLAGTFRVACAVLGAGMLTVASAPFAWTLAALALAGLGASGVNVAANALVARTFPARTGSALNLLGLAAGLGGLALPILVAGAASLLPVATLGGVALALAVVGTGGGAPSSASVAPEDAAWTGSALAPWLVALLLQGGNEAALAAWIPAVAHEAGASGAEALRVLSWHWAGIVAGRVTLVAVVDRVGRVPAAIACSLLAAAGTVLLVLAHQLVPGAALAGLGISGVYSTVMAEASARHPRGGTALFTRLIGAGQVGGVLLPAAVAGLAGGSSAPYVGRGALLVTASTLAVAALVAVSARRGRGARR